MRRRWILGLSVLLVPAALSAQPGPRRAPGGDVELPNVARLLLNNRAELGLTNDQASRLEALARQSEERRTALTQQMQALRERAAAGEELTEEERGRMRDAARQAAEARREVNEGIRSVLTMEQYGRVARLGAALRGLGGEPGVGPQGRRGPGQQGFGPRGRRDGMPGFGPRQRGHQGPRFRNPGAGRSGGGFEPPIRRRIGRDGSI